MRALLLLSIVVLVGCEDSIAPTAPSPILEDTPDTTITNYMPVFRGRCPSNNELPFDIRDNGWYWVDHCQNNYGETVRLSDWCSGIRKVDGDSCVLVTTEPPPPPPPPPPSTLALNIQGYVVDGSRVPVSISGGTAPYYLTTTAGGFCIGTGNLPCTGGVGLVRRLTVRNDRNLIWIASGTEPGDTAVVRITDHLNKTLSLIITVA